MHNSDIDNWSKLLSSAQKGDARAKEQLFQELMVILRLVLQCRLRGWSVQDREDILMNTIAVVVEKLDTIDDHPERYALKVLRNKIGDALRLRPREIKKSISATGYSEDDEKGIMDAIQLPTNEEGFDKRLENIELIEGAKRALKKLSPFCQALFLALLEPFSSSSE